MATPPFPEAKIEATEAKFADAAGKFNEQLLDMNLSQTAVAKKLSDLLAQRAKLLEMHGVSVDRNWASALGGSSGTGSWGASSQQAMMRQMAEMMWGGKWGAPEVRWTSKLHELLAKRLKRPLTKGDVQFNTQPADDLGKTFVSTVTFTGAKQEYVSAGPAKSKKDAESSAAEVALEAEFHSEYQSLKSWDSWSPQGQKRKATTSESSGTITAEGKSRLSQLMQFILGRPTTKADVVYETADPSGGTTLCSSTVTFPTYQPDLAFSGEGKSRKEAETAAANAACAVLEETAAPLIEEHKAKKARKGKKGQEVKTEAASLGQ